MLIVYDGGRVVVEIVSESRRSVKIVVMEKKIGVRVHGCSTRLLSMAAQMTIVYRPRRRWKIKYN